MNRRSFLALAALPLFAPRPPVPDGVFRIPDIVLGWDIIAFGPKFHGQPGYDVIFTYRETGRRWGKSVSQAYLQRHNLSVRAWAIREIPRLNMSPVVEV